MNADFCSITLNINVDFIRLLDCINCIKMFGSGWAVSAQTPWTAWRVHEREGRIERNFSSTKEDWRRERDGLDSPPRFMTDRRYYWRESDDLVSWCLFLSGTSSQSQLSSCIHLFMDVIDGPFNQLSEEKNWLLFSVIAIFPTTFRAQWRAYNIIAAPAVSNGFQKFIYWCELHVDSGINVTGWFTEWPLVWKTWKCQGIWNMSGKCQG